jgi:glutamate dehydrogenase
VRESLSFKLRSDAVPEMPKPFPLFEVFVYSAEMEAIHLRGGMVARGASAGRTVARTTAPRSSA